MMAQRSGRIIILSSQLAYIGRPNYTAYSAAKGSLLTFRSPRRRSTGRGREPR
jgi:short-subunit dehydrogenase